MSLFIYGLVAGSLITFIVYHWGLQPILQKLRDDAIQKAKDAIGKKVGGP